VVSLAWDPLVWPFATLSPMAKRTLHLLLFGAALWPASGLLTAQQLPRGQNVVEVPAIGDGLCLASVFQAHMVVQRDQPLAVWGWAAPGEEVTVTFNGREARATAGEDRAWRLELEGSPMSREPLVLQARTASALVQLADILVGDVWVLGGQSNMEFELEKVENGPLEIVAANYPGLRILTVPYAEGSELRRSFPRLHEWSDWFGRHFRKGHWDRCTPEIARELSAIGYAFARRVHMASGVPIGVIDASRGGTTAETWTPYEVLQTLDRAPVNAALEGWAQRVAEWDPAADLERRSAEARAKGEPLPTDLRPGPSADPNHPGSQFASMVGPLLGLRVKGVLFHQGYNNALDGERGVQLYAEVFPALVRAWRSALGDPALPFGILSLCTDGPPQTRDDVLEKMYDAGVSIRAIHYRTFLDGWRAGDRGLGYASTFDLRRAWYHPQVKLPAGERIARWALATLYGFERELAWRPPALLEHMNEEGAVRLVFDTEVSDPQGGAMVGFTIAGDDRRFQPAEAQYVEVGKDDRGRPKLDQRQLRLTSPLVAAPRHFRYAWARNPLANVQATGNKDLPLATQRSDDWGLGEFPLAEEEAARSEPLARGAALKALRAEDLRRRLAEARALLEQHGEQLPR